MSKKQCFCDEKDELKDNYEISLSDILSMEEMGTYNLETWINEFFNSFNTISIKGYERKYGKEELQILLKEIKRLQNGGNL